MKRAILVFVIFFLIGTSFVQGKIYSHNPSLISSGAILFKKNFTPVKNECTEFLQSLFNNTFYKNFQTKDLEIKFKRFIDDHPFYFHSFYSILIVYISLKLFFVNEFLYILILPLFKPSRSPPFRFFKQTSFHV